MERGFRFLKDPVLFAHSLFLKNPARIMALIMVMTVALLVFSLAERQLRLRLKEKCFGSFPDRQADSISNHALGIPNVRRDRSALDLEGWSGGFPPGTQFETGPPENYRSIETADSKMLSPAKMKCGMWVRMVIVLSFPRR
ncbi:MAG: hypothetical protein FJZ96_03370 [Chloroflexi bacterium]|nr:hypothetical protein [Chloroflexota bacterium]